jgi:3-hexulose-6-phosphate synthase/6-phospho-3-hexuloisomerase
MEPILQVALDFIDLHRAINVAKEAVEGGIDWIEAGTPLIKSCGLESVRQLKKLFPDKTIVADMKIMDAGRTEVEIAAKSGADIVVVMGNASDETIKESIEAGKNYGIKIMVDLMESAYNLTRAKQVADLKPDYIGTHIPIDQQMTGKTNFEKIKEITENIDIPLAVAGGLNSENIVDAIQAGAKILIIGGAITKSENAISSTKKIKEAVSKRIKIPTELYKRVDSLENIHKIFKKVSTSNISDAMHRKGWIKGIMPIIPIMKLFGPAVTVRTYPGDWAKPVEAVDIATEGSIIVIDAGGVAPAVWGELATHSAVIKKISGVVINGAIRDVEEIKKIKFPSFSSIICPQAGEPKGFGEINITIVISGISISPGDWIIGDDNGIVCIPKDNVIEIANRAMDVLEKENRLRKEIDKGGTLSQITEILKWEKQK